MSNVRLVKHLLQRPAILREEKNKIQIWGGDGRLSCGENPDFSDVCVLQNGMREADDEYGADWHYGIYPPKTTKKS